MFRRVLATTAATLTLCGLAAIPALPAHASPEDGEGCIGLPDVPAAFVCVISVTPTAVAPTVTTSSIPVTVPRFCYLAGCTSPTTVNVPVPGVTPSTGNVAVIWYRGTNYPIGYGTGAVVQPIVDGVVAQGAALAGTATALAGTVVTYVRTTADNVTQFAVTTAGNAVTTVNGAVATANGLVATVTQIVLAQVQAVIDTVPTTGELQAAVNAAVAQAIAIANGAVATTTEFVRERVTEPILEIWEPIRDELNEFDANEYVQERLERLQPTFDRVAQIIEDALNVTL